MNLYLVRHPLKVVLMIGEVFDVHSTQIPGFFMFEKIYEHKILHKEKFTFYRFQISNKFSNLNFRIHHCMHFTRKYFIFRLHVDIHKEQAMFMSFEMPPNRRMCSSENYLQCYAFHYKRKWARGGYFAHESVRSSQHLHFQKFPTGCIDIF